ncbi:MAG: protein kinase [Chloroflexota bacterium]|nr:protein kinase [Chloroflexota bacterium]
MIISAPLPAGKLLQNRYMVGRVIGHGGMGAVYEAHDHRLNKRVALKQILRVTEAGREAFEHEAQLLANINHPALPKVYDFFPDADSLFITMDYIDGDDLGAILQQRGPLDVNEVLGYADQLLDVLCYLHGQPSPIIHRDIKPQNIKITQAGKPILLDFGISKGRVGLVSHNGQDESITAWTPHYASPEQFLREGTDARSDVFSLAATLYQLLTNQRPVPIDERIAHDRNGQPDPLLPANRVNGRVPHALSALLQQAMSLKAERRPASALVFRDALRALDVQDARVEDEPTTEGPQVASVRRPSQSNSQHTAETPPAVPARALAQPYVPSSGDRNVVRSGQMTLQKRIHALITNVFDSYPGAFVAWCDPRGDWEPLLQRVADDGRLGRFELMVVTERTAEEIGGIARRREVQSRIAEGASFVLLVRTSPDQLGWLWAHALRSEVLYSKSLRSQLLEWGWRPASPTMTDDELAVLARQSLQQDPAAWGGGGLQPDVPLLLEVLAGGAEPTADQAYVLDLTIDQAGLPRFEPEASTRWRARSLARLLVTQAYHVAPRLIGTAHELLIAEGQRSLALDVLNRWQDSLRLSKRLPDAIMEADRIAVLGGQLRDATAKSGPFLSRAAENAVFVATCTRLAEKNGKDLLQSLAALYPDLERHAASFWGDAVGRADALVASRAIPWSELIRLSRAAQVLLDVFPAKEWATPHEAVAWYTSGGWRLDMAGEELVRDLAQSTPELLRVITPLRETYRARWEKSLIQWSEVWHKASCPTPSLTTAGEWLARLLAAPRPTAILFIDALRYDLGSVLAEHVNTQEGAVRASVSPARAPLPSITALGMGMALPLREQDVQADIVNGSWQLVDTISGTNLSIAETRRTWLQAQGVVRADDFLTVMDIVSGHVPEPAKGRTRLFIADNSIDRLGHDDELERMGSSIPLDRYQIAITALRNAGWRRILIVTDHGFIHWPGGAEKHVPVPLSGAAYRSRRTLAYAPHIELGDSHAWSPGNKWKVLPARGASCWSAYGGLGYFHGGASLQEMIIPCLHIEWPTMAQPVNVSIQPIEHILSLRPRVTINIERETMLIEDALPRQIEVLIRLVADGAVLMRSATLEVTPSQEQVTVTLRLAPDVHADWDAPLRIEVRDTTTEEVVASTPSILRVELDAW